MFGCQAFFYLDQTKFLFRFLTRKSFSSKMERSYYILGVERSRYINSVNRKLHETTQLDIFRVYIENLV